MCFSYHIEIVSNGSSLVIILNMLIVYNLKFQIAMRVWRIFGVKDECVEFYTYTVCRAWKILTSYPMIIYNEHVVVVLLCLKGT